jgi:hypothetical protein
MLKVGDVVKRVYRESFPESDTVHKVERFNPEGTKAVLRGVYQGEPSGKAVSVKIENIKTGRPISGTFNGTYYV